jgi:fumarate reductase subunit D
MDWIEMVMEWARSHQATLWWIFAGSMTLVLLTPIVVAWAVIRLPADYFTDERRSPLETWQHRPVVRAVLLVAKNLVGVVLLVAGIAMLVLPGQGLLTIVVSLALLDFPGKFRLERGLALRRPVWRSMNWLRQRAGKPELERPVK